LWIGGAIVVVGLLAVGIGMAVRAVLRDPEVPFLISEGGAQWIRFDEPFNLKGQQRGESVAGFRTRFVVEQPPKRAVLTFRALRAANIEIDDQRVYATAADHALWKRRHQVDLAEYLTPGPHKLVIMVENRAGPPCALAYCQALGLHTDAAWEASNDGQTWAQAVPAGRRWVSELSRQFPRADRAFAAKWYVWSPLFLAVFVLALGWDRVPLRVTARSVRWTLLAAWVVLAANNIGKVPLFLGFDFEGHMDYIQYIADNRRLPLANEGWTMFQAPLFHLVSAPIFAVTTSLFSLETMGRALRVIPLLCGMVQIELAYRAVRHVWPEREDLQALGAFVGGLLPMNLYMSQYIGNEPLTGCLVGLVVVVALGLHRDPAKGLTNRHVLLLGLLLGLAVLSKVTALLMAPPLALLLVSASLTQAGPANRRFMRAAAALGMVFGAAFLVAGWYYVRNWVELGTPFLGGWESLRGLEWWQCPGFRTPGQFCAFGEALAYPVYACTASFWDGVYSTLWLDGDLSGIAVYDYVPPWNYGFVLSGAWLALPLMAALVVGVAVTARRPARAAANGLLFCVGCLGLYLAAMLYGFLVAPMYCVVKASYTLGLIPCYAVLIAAGFDRLARGRAPRAIMCGAVACWGVAAYLAYFVVSAPVYE